MPQKRKRKRTRLNWGPILVLAAAAVLVSGFVYSPLTSVSRVTVVGAKEMDRRNIDSILGTLNKIPCIMVNPRWVETRMQRIESVYHASYSQNIFGRGHLDITYRIPVARVKSKWLIGLDRQGVMFQTDVLPVDLPVVERPPTARDLPMTIAGSFPAGYVAELAEKAHRAYPKEKIRISFKPDGALCLGFEKGLVTFGACDDLDQKLKALGEIQAEHPDLFTDGKALNLTDPSHPVTTYNKQRE